MSEQYRVDPGSVSRSDGAVPSPAEPSAATDPRRRPGLSVLERSLLGLLIAAAVVLRLVQVAEPLDRQFDGFQGAFFAVCAINYERLEGAHPAHTLLPRGAGDGYPVVNLDLDPAAPDTWYLYANHPPTVPWLAWSSLALFAPDGWDQAWREGLPPAGIEAPLRAPFMALNLLGLVALFLALRAAGCRRAAWYATLFYAWTPAALLYAGLVNYENPTVPFVLAGVAAAVCYARGGRAAWLAATFAAFACAGAVTYAALFTAAALALLLPACGWSRAARLTGAAVAGSLAPLALHGARAGALLEQHGESMGTLGSRVRTMVAPLLDGTTPLGTWLGVQAKLLTEEVGIALSLLAAGGLAIGVGRMLRRSHGDGTRDADLSAHLALALVVGGCAMQLAFYRHTRDPQDPFILHLVPGLAAAAGVLIARLSSGATPAARWLVLTAALAVVVEGGLRSAQLHGRWRGAGPELGQSSAAAPLLPAPSRLGPALAELLPAGDVAWYPGALGLGPATSFYAWRTLLPVTPGSYEATQLSQNDLGLEQATTWLAIPTAVPPSAQAAVDELLANLEAALPGSVREPSAANAGWRLWRLRN
ncbi:hypothetical protein [Engelhardtia mirabilis]|uniref:Glycosyltransferase RgtA/B/C/D-like domain-containing protein n=1 Tax=Engelhardtia mirabilis TaxID=2528011 RepID=A0A518BNW9_9BACT|nr:hypothetical protein Pla133_37730 [Planctomycetes bacterium Pla133]QDV02998.1 hypothetical protein Pla86_37720 [Planctomycetes bacterium Pla86]